MIYYNNQKLILKQNIGFRGWFYFRQGWTTYFAFIFAAINTMVVTYYLAIENIPVLKTVFPTFYIYLAIVALFGVPLLILVGYAHQKKTASYRAEADIYYESNPHALREYNQIEFLLKSHIKIIDIMILDYELKNIDNPKILELKKYREEIEKYFQTRNSNKVLDLELFKKFNGLK